MVFDKLKNTVRVGVLGATVTGAMLGRGASQQEKTEASPCCH